MNKFKLFILFYSIFGLFTAKSLAQTCEDNNGTVVAFINGVKTTRNQAKEHLQNLKEKILSLNLDPNGVEVFPSYNHHEGWFEDIMQSLFQKLEIDYPGQFWSIIFGHSPIDLSEETQDLIRQVFSDSIVKWIQDGNQTNTSIISQLQSILDDKKKLIIIGHSQGSLYANSSYQALLQNEKNVNRKNIIGLLHVASVAPSVGSDEFQDLANYTTFNGDIIVNITRTNVGNVLSGNNPVSGILLPLMVISDYTLHGFSEIYIKNKFSIFENPLLLQIKNQILNIKSHLQCVDAYGCFAIDPSVGLPGKFFTNPDGTEGGFVSNDSTVSPTVYLGAEAEVCNGAQVFGQATIVGPALISDSGTVVNNNAFINGNILVNSGAQILQSAQMLGHSGIGMGAELTGNAILKDSAVAIGNVEISEDADIGGNSFLVSFGDPQEKVEVKGQVKISGSYIIGQNAKLNGDFIISGGPSAVTGPGVTLSGAGNIISANFSDYVEVDTSNLLADGSGNPNNQSILVFGNAKIFGEPKLSGQTVIFENSTIEGSGQVKDNSFIFGEAIIGGDAIVSGASNISGNCVLETGLFENVGIPNINNPADPNNQFCPGYYVPDPMALASTNQLRANFVQTSQAMDMNQMREEAYLAHQNMIEESYKMRDDFLRGKFRAPASQ